MRQPQYSVGINKASKARKKSWKQRLRDWINDSGEVEQLELSCQDSSPRIDADRGINFRVFKAAGGTIVETSFYDRHKDRSHNSLHVVTDGEDLGKAIGKIITMETLKL
jgi:hypothetical protein